MTSVLRHFVKNFSIILNVRTFYGFRFLCSARYTHTYNIILISIYINYPYYICLFYIKKELPNRFKNISNLSDTISSFFYIQLLVLIRQQNLFVKLANYVFIDFQFFTVICKQSVNLHLDIADLCIYRCRKPFFDIRNDVSFKQPFIIRA